MNCKILLSIKKKIVSAEIFTQHAKVLKYRKHFLGDLQNFASLHLVRVYIVYHSSGSL